MIEVRNLSKNFGKKQVIFNLSISIGAGQRILILGQNGCGKTTFLKILVGQIQTYHGQISYDKEKVKISALIETPQFIETWSGADNLFYFLASNEIPQALFYARTFGIEGDLENKVKTYSLGMKQKLLLTLTLARNCHLILLDEPYIGLDSDTIIKLDSIIKELTDAGKSIIVVSHILTQSADMFTIYRFVDKKLVPVNYEYSNFCKYKIDFANPQGMKYAKESDSNLKIVTEDGCSFSCFLEKEKIPEYIKIFSNYHLVQAQKIQFRLEDIAMLEEYND